jgi:hypothetical protein
LITQRVAQLPPVVVAELLVEAGAARQVRQLADRVDIRLLIAELGGEPRRGVHRRERGRGHRVEARVVDRAVQPQHRAIALLDAPQKRRAVRGPRQLAARLRRAARDQRDHREAS